MDAARFAGTCSCTPTANHSTLTNGNSGSQPSARRPATRRSPSTPDPGQAADPPCSASSTPTADAASQTAPAVDQHSCTELHAFRACPSRLPGKRARPVPRGRRRSNAPPLPDWKPVYYALEDRFQVWLCNAHHVKNVPGRKTDMSDAEWLADVAAHGMVRPSFVPPPPVRELRELTRYRKTQVDARAAEIARVEKVLQDAGVKLTSVASKVLTQSGRAMIEALIAGERGPAALAGLAKGKLRPKIPQLTEALDGHFGAHHAIVAARILTHLDSLDATIAALSAEIAQRVAAGYQRALDLLLPVPGLDRLTIEVVIAETGADMSCFPSPAHLASWAGLCPGNHESAGKRRRVATPPGNELLRRTLIAAARAAARPKGSYFA